MKLQNIFGLVATVIGLAGCASSENYDPSLKPAATGERIKVESLSAKPAQPIAPEPWRVTMKVKNVSDRPLENLTYQFMLGGKGEELGKGKIARLAPGETVSVTSEEAKLEQGTYRVEGRVFLENPGLEPEYSDRINNWKAISVVVAQ